MKRPAGSEELLVILATLVCLVPFLNKAFNADDPLFIWTAQQISAHPFDFYGFGVNWYGTVSPMAEITKNPPGVCYYLALIGRFWGWSELALHGALLIPAVAAALGMFYLARLLCATPLLAALAGIATPVFLVSATGVMCDITMLALLTWSVFFWIRGMGTNRQRDFLFSAVLIAICSLTKYFGIALLPLLGTYAIAKKRGPGLWIGALLIPVASLAAYHWITHLMYGRGLLGDAALYATGFQSLDYRTIFTKGLITLSFTGGCVASVLFYLPLLWSRKGRLISMVVMVLLVVILLYLQQVGTLPLLDGDSVKWHLVVQLAVMVMTGAAIIALALGDFLTCKNAESLLLALWVLGTFIFAGFINWTINARSILPLVPAAGILLMRRIERYSRTAKSRRGISWAVWPLIPSMCISIMVSWADYQWAGTARTAALEISTSFEKRGGNTLWFLGHWGFQYYLEALSGKALDLNNQNIMPGDIVVIPANNSFGRIKNIDSFHKKNPLLQLVEVGPRQWLTTMNPAMGAGFYSHLWGPLPFVFGLADQEKYYVYMIKQQSNH